MRREAVATLLWLTAHLSAAALQSAVQPCTNGTVRLVDGPVESAGRVEVCIHGVWGRVCSGSWDSSAARVVCTQLGYSVNISEGIIANPASFDGGTGPVFLDYVKCSGTESSLLSCFYRVIYYSDVINDCTLSDDAGVVCPSSIHSCTNGTLRLVDGSLESAGTVEVCINGVWGRVCNFLLGDRFARVVCRQLGYSVNTGQAIPVEQGIFESGTGPVLLNNVDCFGTESSLLSCTHSTNPYCSHLSNVGVVCPSSAQDCTNGTFRLAHGPVESAGRVEICVNGVWGRVCDNGWDINNARVVCRQLGYNVNAGGVIAINGATDQASFGQGNGPVFLSNLGCTGNESSLLNCSNQGIGVVYCLDFNDVGVICPSADNQPCTNGTLRLVDGPLESAGRVEICINGVWGTVCSSYPHSSYSRVVCRQLGYTDNSSASIAVFYAFGQGTGPVFLNNMRCTGAESSLLDCNYTWPDVHQCSHLADGGVVCPPSARHCTDGSLRLVNGSLGIAGRVEVCINGVWGTVCPDSWDNNDARVVCRQLGYSVNTSKAIAVLYSIIGQVTGPALLRNVGCTGTESSLLSCNHEVAYCLHSFTAGVVCPSPAQSCTNGTLRLVNGLVESAGTVEVCINGVWGTVCGTSWDNTAARVICRQLGYSANTGGIFTVFRAAFGEGAGPVLVHGVSCTGTESSLLNCSHQIGVTYCSHFYDVGVVCPPSIQSCTNGTVRLVNGSLESAGRVEICINGVWGTVCDKYKWDGSAARVVCRQLGYSVDTGGAIAAFQAAFGQGTGPVFLSNVQCTGNESSLLSCSHQGIGVTSCDHSYDAGAVCPPGPCQTNPCANGGTCTAQDTTNYTCSCAAGFTGTNCSSDLNFCEPTTCVNGGTCIEGYGPATTCICAEGFTGTRCEIDLPFCEVDTCLNGGTCREGFGTVTTCNCAAGFTGANCSVDLNFCTPGTCLSGGTCIEGYGTATTCICVEGFTGTRCDIDLPFCEVDTCLNGGTCCEGPGTLTTCDCAAGFTGANCSSDLNFCTPNTCLNGGTCVEGYGTATRCICAEGFTGTSCDIDLPFCEIDTCLNGGTCIEGPGTLTTCDCAAGFTGANCSSDLNFCTSSTCLNGGTCIEGYGTETLCVCSKDFSGPNCTTHIPVQDECKADPCHLIMYDQPVDYSRCGFTNITFKLCQTQLLLRTSTEQAATDLANITSNTTEISAVDVFVATSIIENLTTAAIANEEVRESYLESIDNLIQVDADVVAESQNERQSSSRLIGSLTNFINNLAITNSTSATFTRKTYALQLHDINTSSFHGQTLSVDLGSVQEAMSISNNIQDEAIQAIEGNRVFQNRTASVQVPSSIFQDLGQSDVQQRLSYSVFVRDTLFQSSDENQSNLTVGSIIVAVRVNGTTASGNLSTPINVTFQASELADNASNIVCGRWNPQANGELGAWITANSCENASSSSASSSSSSSSAYSTRSTQSLENSLRTTTRPTFIAQYPQPGYFAVLLDLTVNSRPAPVYVVVLQDFVYVGLVISLLFLTAFIITHLVSRTLRKKEHEQILINLCLALMGMYLVFILGANAAPVPVLCGISAALLQYFMLVFFSWTAVEAFYLYQMLVKVLRVRQISVLKISLVVWLVPILIVGVSAGPGYKYYYQESKSGFCRARDLPFYIGLIAPTAILYTFNLIIFILIMVSVCKQRIPGSVTEKSTCKNVIIALTLAILFGLGWGFGLAASGTPSEETTFALQLLFTIFVGCQGLLIFVLHGVRKAEARDEWKKWFYTVTCRQSHVGVVESFSTPPLSKHARSQVASSSSSAYDLSPLPNEVYFESSTDTENGIRKASESPPPQRKMMNVKKEMAESEPHAASSESKQVRRHHTSLLTSITRKYRKYDLISHDSPPPICTESDSKGLLECEEEEEEEERKRGVEEEEEEKVRPPCDTSALTANDSHT